MASLNVKYDKKVTASGIQRANNTEVFREIQVDGNSKVKTIATIDDQPRALDTLVDTGSAMKFIKLNNLTRREVYKYEAFH